MEIGKKLKEARQMSGLTQENVAEKLLDKPSQIGKQKNFIRIFCMFCS